MKKHIYVLDILFCAMCLFCVVCCIVIGFFRPALFFVCIFAMLVLGLVLALNVHGLRRFVARLLYGTGQADSVAQNNLADVSLPVMVAQRKRLLWYNHAFLTDVLGGEYATLVPVDQLLPALDREAMASEQGQALELNGKCYTVYGSHIGTNAQTGLYLAYFVNTTSLTREAVEYHATRPSVLVISVDTYDDVLKELKDSERARLSGEIEAALEEFIGGTTGFLRRVSSSRYLAVVEERHMEEMVRNRFSVLDAVRALGGETASVTLSIGVGRLGATLRECEDMAAQALDMALGRGGDQAAVRSPDGFEFYGGVSRSVEKRSKVRSRILANALCDLVRQSEQVFILGHKASDLDSLGASAGIWRICQMCGKPASIVVNEKKSLAANLVEKLREAGCDVMEPDGMENAVTQHTLVVIVDTHLRCMLENPAIYDNAPQVVVIDHHRRCVGYIENSVILYHEPSASSASELVAELVQYADSERSHKLSAAEAEALLAGIMLDTRDFSIHTGVRTFEAAAFLRCMGAQTGEVKKLFRSTPESYAYRAQLVTSAELFQNCAIATADFLPPDQQVAVPQAANDLLTLEGVQASFVAVKVGDQVLISARSMGEVNVQIIMEKLGGGGHLMMAGAQLKNVDLAEAKQRLLDAVACYHMENSKKS